MLALVGIPMWIWTTSIYRAPLNYTMMNFYDNNIDQEISVQLPVYLNVGIEFPSLCSETQRLLDDELRDNGINNWSINLIQGKGSSKDYNIDFRVGERDVFVISDYSRELLITYTLNLVAKDQVPEFLVAVLLDHLFDQEIALIKNYKSVSNKVVAYSPTYHLTFSLFVGDGEPIEWDILPALQEHFSPLRSALSSSVANLTIDTQVQYYSSLTNSAPQTCEQAGTACQYIVDSEYLSTFVNFAEWSLTSIHSYPTIHFILYVPSRDQTPMTIADSSSNSFSIPQWGGVMIMNRPDRNHLSSKDLLPVLETFSSQLLSLLGAPQSPKSPSIRLDTLSRISTLRALSSASSTLGSLYRLSQSLPNIAIPKPVLYAVEDTLIAIRDSLVALQNANWVSAIKTAGSAMIKSEQAFFDRMMVQQVFFPDEHKVAIYLPLLGPIGVVLITGLVRIVKEFKQAKTAAK